MIELNAKRQQTASILEPWHAIESSSQDLPELLALAQIDDDLVDEVFLQAQETVKKLALLERQRMFADDNDPNPCFIEIQAGSGGTEAQDWAAMLLRMYLRWAEKNSMHPKLIEQSDGEIAGIKSASIELSGPYAYGWMRSESGVHRLVRKSPFDSGNRRHTSFASIFVSPKLSDDIEINLNLADCRIDTYRASGAGGQHVNKTDSAVRITHLPTNTVAQCQSERSQHQNKDRAISQLKSKLYELERQEKLKAKAQLESTKKTIGWGSQIRSYVLDDGRIKDHRSGIETGNIQGFLDGQIDEFIEATLKWMGEDTGQ